MVTIRDLGITAKDLLKGRFRCPTLTVSDQLIPPRRGIFTGCVDGAARVTCARDGSAPVLSSTACGSRCASVEAVIGLVVYGHPRR